MKLSPSVRGIALLNWATTVFAARIAACIASTDRPERAEPVGVGRRHVDEDGVEREQAALEQPRDVAQEHRDELGPPLVDGLPRVRADEQRPVAEVRRHLRGQVRPGSLGVEVDHADVVEFRCSRHEGVEQDRGHRRGALEVDLVARPDVGDGLVGSDDPRTLASHSPGDHLRRTPRAHERQCPVSIRCFATNAAAWARRSRLSFERIELT